MASDSQQSIVFMPYDPLAPKAKRKAKESTMMATTSFSKSDAPLVAEDSGTDKISSPSEETEQQYICSSEPPEPPVDMLHSKERSTSHLYQHSIAVLEELGDTAPVPRGSHQDVDASPAPDNREGERPLDAADTRLIVKDFMEVFPGSLQAVSDADCSLADVADRLQRCKRARSHSADAVPPLVGPSCSDPRRYSTHAESVKRKKSSKDGWGDAAFIAGSKIPPPCQENDSSHIFPRDEEGRGDSDMGSSECSDQEIRPANNIKRQLLHGTKTRSRPRVDRCSTTEASEIEDSANDNDRFGSEVVKNSRVSSTLPYHRNSEVLSAAPQRRRRASVETPCRSRQSHRVKHSSTAPRKTNLNSDTVQMKPMRASTLNNKQLQRQRRTSPAGAVRPCGPNDNHKAIRGLFEISGLSSHSRPNSDTVVADLRALEPHSLTTASIPGLEAFGAGYQTLHRIQRTQESWLLIGFRDCTPAPLSHIGRTTSLSDLNPESHMSQYSTGLESGIAEDSSEEGGDEYATDDVRGLSSREPWTELDDCRLLSYRNKEKMDWTEICEHFLGRTEGAVKTRYYSLREAKAYRK